MGRLDDHEGTGSTRSGGGGGGSGSGGSGLDSALSRWDSRRHQRRPMSRSGSSVCSAPAWAASSSTSSSSAGGSRGGSDAKSSKSKSGRRTRDRPSASASASAAPLAVDRTPADCAADRLSAVADEAHGAPVKAVRVVKAIDYRTRGKATYQNRHRSDSSASASASASRRGGNASDSTPRRSGRGGRGRGYSSSSSAASSSVASSGSAWSSAWSAASSRYSRWSGRWSSSRYGSHGHGSSRTGSSAFSSDVSALSSSFYTVGTRLRELTSERGSRSFHGSLVVMFALALLVSVNSNRRHLGYADAAYHRQGHRWQSHLRGPLGVPDGGPPLPLSGGPHHHPVDMEDRYERADRQVYVPKAEPLAFDHADKVEAPARGSDRAAYRDYFDRLRDRYEVQRGREAAAAREGRADNGHDRDRGAIIDSGSAAARRAANREHYKHSHPDDDDDRGSLRASSPDREGPRAPEWARGGENDSPQARGAWWADQTPRGHRPKRARGSGIDVDDVAAVQVGAGARAKTLVGSWIDKVALRGGGGRNAKSANGLGTAGFAPQSHRRPTLAGDDGTGGGVYGGGNDAAGRSMSMTEDQAARQAVAAAGGDVGQPKMKEEADMNLEGGLVHASLSKKQMETALAAKAKVGAEAPAGAAGATAAAAAAAAAQPTPKPTAAPTTAEAAAEVRSVALAKAALAAAEAALAAAQH